MKVVYATDLDRTLIFSRRFLNENNIKDGYEIAELDGEKEISYIDSEVKAKLFELNLSGKVEFVPVTNRSLAEYKRVNIGLNNKYAITTGGGVILENGEIIKEWDEYTRKNIDMTRFLDLIDDISDLYSISSSPKIIDGKYIFTKLDLDKKDSLQVFECEIQNLVREYPEIEFSRSNRKLYAIPKIISKETSLKWLLENKLDYYKVVSSGDSYGDLCMGLVSDIFFLPEHSKGYDMNIYTDKVNVPGNIKTCDKFIKSPLEALHEVEKFKNELK